LMAEDVIELNSAETIQGKSIRTSVKDGTVFVNNARVVATDIPVSNGVIHVIDAVLLPPEKNIAEIAVDNGNFTTLVAALEAAGLVETLQGDGPFTIFAPSDDAFAALPAGTVDALLNDIPALTETLLYHVVPGEIFSSEVVESRYAETAEGQPVIISVEDSKVMINDAEVNLADIQATNGVIHVIDSVLLPPTMDIVDTAVEDGRFTTLVVAVETAGLVDALKREGPLTVFAPTDEAFLALPAGTVDALLNDIPALTDILQYHVVDGRIFSSDAAEISSADTLQGKSVTISTDADGNLMINNAKVVISDLITSNGVIHVIDAVLLPAGS
jgi:transforming growth factor-beta-induced protein